VKKLDVIKLDAIKKILYATNMPERAKLSNIGSIIQLSCGEAVDSLVIFCFKQYQEIPESSGTPKLCDAEFDDGTH